MVNFTSLRPPILTAKIKTKLDSMELVFEYVPHKKKKSLVKRYTLTFYNVNLKDTIQLKKMQI